jgi:leucyl-tRNA synthetase
MPALAYLELLGANPNSANDAIEFATKALYREESHWGVMAAGSHKGKREQEARELIKGEMKKMGHGFEIYVLANEEPVICRCGTRVVVKVVDGQWFINYGNKEWKAQVREHFQLMRIRPEKARLAFEHTIDWIDLRPAERAQGLGTKFPFNPGHIIESLSDSTIYMIFYTFVNILRSNDIKPESLTPEFFDYVLAKKGNAKKVSKGTGIDETVIESCREAVDYWYKRTSNHSGSDLVTNHLTMYVFNHVALLPKEYWPKQIVVNGLVSYEGQKMSKSLGNIIPLSDGIAKFGSDPLRFVETANAELDSEADFNTEAVNGTKQRNEFLRERVEAVDEMAGDGQLTHIDYWLYSVLNSKIKSATEEMENLNVKNAYSHIYYESIAQIKRYLERGGINSLVMREFLEKVVLMLGPAMPHVAEELWSMLGKNTLIVKERWPTFEEAMISTASERMEELVTKTLEDTAETIKLTSKMKQNEGKKPRTVRIILADDWKMKAYNTLARTKDIKKAIAEKEEGIDAERVAKFVGLYSKRLMELQPVIVIKTDDMVRCMKEASKYLSERLNAEIVVEKESESKSERAGRAAPEKPSIDVTWG